MKINKQVVKFGVVMGALVAVAGVQQAQAATTDSTQMTLVIQDLASIEVTSPDLIVTPELADFAPARNKVETTDAPITLAFDSTRGSTITWAATGDITATDIKLDAGSGWIASGGTLQNTAVQEDGATMNLNVQISNLRTYAIDSHVSTLTFTIEGNEDVTP